MVRCAREKATVRLWDQHRSPCPGGATGVTQCVATAPARLAQVGHRLLQVHSRGCGGVGVLPAIALAGVVCLGQGTGELVLPHVRLLPSVVKGFSWLPPTPFHHAQLFSALTLHHPPSQHSPVQPQDCSPCPVTSLHLPWTAQHSPPAHSPPPQSCTPCASQHPILHPLSMHSLHSPSCSP